MASKTLTALCGFALIGTLAACDRGSATNDTLVDGAVDRPAAGTDTITPNPGGAVAADPAAAGPTLSVATQSAHGGHLVDGAGTAVYHLEGDRDGSKCIGDCLTAWPPVLVTDVQPSGATGLQGSMIATIARPEGTTQVSFNGLPLYRYAGDAGVGSANGHGVKDTYGTWLLVTPQGTPIAAGHAGH